MNDPQRVRYGTTATLFPIPDRVRVRRCSLFQTNDDHNQPAILTACAHLDPDGNTTLDRLAWLINETGGDLTVAAIEWRLGETLLDPHAVNRISRIGLWIALSGSAHVEFGFELDMATPAERELASAIGWLDELAVTFTVDDPTVDDIVFIRLADNPLTELFGHND